MNPISTTAVVLLGLTWFAYPLVLVFLASIVRRRRGPAVVALPGVSVILASRDDPARVRARVEDLLQSTYPPELIEIVVGIDLSAEWPPEAYQSDLLASVRVVPGDGPGGKPGNLNAAVRASNHPVLVFADTGQRFAPDAIGHLVDGLSEEGVGAVSGGYRLTSGNPVTRAYWVLERLLRRSEASLHSMVGVTGAIYALRRDLWVDLPPGLLCDDLYVPMQSVLRGHRVLFREDALAMDPRAFTHTQEYRRKVRTQAGILQLCAWLPQVLNPRRNPIWVQFVFHKLLRMATPVLLVVATLGMLPGMLRLGARLPGDLLPFSPPVSVALAVGVALLLTRLRLVRRALGEAAWTAVLLLAPLTAYYRAARGQWDVW